MTDQLLLY